MKKLETLFRGKRVDTGEWTYGNYVEKISPHFKEPVFWAAFIQDKAISMYKVVPETVGQLRYENQHGQYFDGDIYYCAGYGFDVVTPYCEITDKVRHGEIDDIGKVSGNIHDNPELLWAAQYVTDYRIAPFAPSRLMTKKMMDQIGIQ